MSLTAVLYSDQVIADNAKIDAHLLRLMPKAPRIGYISSGPDPDRRFFKEKVAYYGRYGLTDLRYIPLDQPLDDAADDLLACDAIHLSGGSTSGFLARLRRAGLVEHLRRYADAGGTLIGTSAGAILLTPDIAMDALFAGKPPKRSAESSGLGLVPFEFFPHFGKEPGYLPALIDYSRCNRRPILACRDGDGVVVQAAGVILVGNLTLVEAGRAQPADASRFA
jgi:dipeptidase E